MNNNKDLFSVSRSECCGALEHYDKAFDRITTRNEKQLKSIKRIFHTVTTTDDPVIRKVEFCTDQVPSVRSGSKVKSGFVFFFFNSPAGEDSG